MDLIRYHVARKRAILNWRMLTTYTSVCEGCPGYFTCLYMELDLLQHLYMCIAEKLGLQHSAHLDCKPTTMPQRVFKTYNYSADARLDESTHRNVVSMAVCCL